MNEDLAILSDEELVAASIKNPEIYTVLVNRYKDPLLNFISAHFVHDRAVAEDIVQDAFLKAYLSIERFDLTKKWKTWLYKIAINTAYSVLRKPQPDDIEDYIEVLQQDDSPERFAELQLQKDKLEQAMQHLDPRYRLVLDLFYKQDLSYEEIGTVLDMRVGNVKTRLHRAKQQLIALFGNV